MKAKSVTENKSATTLSYKEIIEEGWYETKRWKILFLYDEYKDLHPAIAIDYLDNASRVTERHKWGAYSDRKFTHLTDFSIQI